MIQFTHEEEITRPDLPKTAARKCRHCGNVYGDHAQTIKPQDSTGCQGIRKNFDPEKHSDDDKDR